MTIPHPLPLLRTLVAALLTSLIASLLVVGLTPAAPVHAADGDQPAPRVWGADRFETAAALAERQFPEGADVVVIARGDDHVDAVTAAPLARHLGGPVLLVTRDSVPQPTVDAIWRMGPDRVVVVGGPAVISDQTAQTAADWRTYERVAGANRYATAAAVAHVIGLQDGVWVASSWQDSLVAASTGTRPVLQTADALPAETAEALRSVGGHVDVLEPQVAEDVRRATDVEVVLHDRMDGTDRSTRLASGPGPSFTVTTASNWPDALAAAAWRPTGPLLLVDPARPIVDQPIRDWLTTHMPSPESLVIVGGPSAVSTDAEQQILDLLDGEAAARHAAWVDANRWRRAPVDIPADAVWIGPADDAAQVVASQPAGTTFAFARGVHTGVEIVPRRGDVFLGEEGAVLDGSTHLPADSFTRDASGLWSRAAVPGTVAHKPEDCQPAAAHHYLEDRGVLCLPEDLFADGDFLRREPSPDAVDAPGEWALADGRIWLHDDPATLGEVRISTAMHAFRAPYQSDVADVRIEGLEIRHYAPRPQEGAVQGTWGVDWVVRNVHAHHNHAHGVQLSAGGVLADSLLADNGQMGFGSRGVTAGATPSLLSVEGNEIARNNRLGFTPSWEGGAMKIMDSTGVRMVGNWVHGNTGHGIWFDTENRDIEILGNVVEDNTGSGIMYEISRGPALIADNLVLRHADKAVWILDSSGVTIRNNVLADSRHGDLHITDDGRRDGAHRALDVTVDGNDLTHRTGRWQSGWRRAPHLAGDQSPSATGVRFSGNTWRTDSHETVAVAFYGVTDRPDHRTWAQWHDLGMDVGGTRLPLHTRPETLPDGQPLPLGR